MAEPLAPIVNDLSRTFWEAAADGVLKLPFCVETGRFFWPPSPSSPFVTGGAVAWGDAPGEGVVRSIAIYRRLFQKALADHLPYGVALVELDQGPRLSVHVADPDRPNAPRPGGRVRLRFQPLREGEIPVPLAETADG